MNSRGKNPLPYLHKMHIKSIEIEMTKNCENSEIIQEGGNTNMHSLSLPVCESELRWHHMFINHNGILSADSTDLQP